MASAAQTIVLASSVPTLPPTPVSTLTEVTTASGWVLTMVTTALSKPILPGVSFTVDGSGESTLVTFTASLPGVSESPGAWRTAGAAAPTETQAADGPGLNILIPAVVAPVVFILLAASVVLALWLARWRPPHHHCAELAAPSSPHGELPAGKTPPSPSSRASDVEALSLSQWPFIMAPSPGAEPSSSAAAVATAAATEPATSNNTHLRPPPQPPSLPPPTLPLPVPPPPVVHSTRQKTTEMRKTQTKAATPSPTELRTSVTSSSIVPLPEVPRMSWGDDPPWE